MRVTALRWLGWLAAACATAAVLTLPFPAAVPRTWGGEPREPLATELRRLTAVAGEASAVVRGYRAAQAVDRWNAANADTVRVRVDASVPEALVGVVRDVGGDQWQRIGPGASPSRAELFVYFDTTIVTRAAPGPVARRSLEPRRAVDISYALPEATDGVRCVAVVRLRTTSAAAVDALRGEQLLGPCGFYAAFGQPGARIRGWLARTGYSAARRSDWDVPRAPATGGSALDQVGNAGGACLTGRRGACLAALGIAGSRAAAGGSTPLSGRLSFVLDADSRGRDIRAGGLDALGNFEARYLADAARELGPVRFAQVWRAPSSPDEAFAAAGVDLEAWTRQWLVRTYGAATTRAPIAFGDVLWIALALPALVAIGARPREQVLATGWLTSRG